MSAASQGAGRGRRDTRRRAPTAIEPPATRLALTVPETAWLLNCSPNTVWNLIGKGDLESFSLGRKRLIARSAVVDFIAQGGSQARRDGE